MKTLRRPKLRTRIKIQDIKCIIRSINQTKGSYTANLLLLKIRNKGLQKLGSTIFSIVESQKTQEDSQDPQEDRGDSIRIRKNLRTCVNSWQVRKQRKIQVIVNLNLHKISIIGRKSYVINDNALVNKIDDFFEQLDQDIIKLVNTREMIFRINWPRSTKYSTWPTRKLQQIITDHYSSQSARKFCYKSQLVFSSVLRNS